jgi:hypothetical protein
MALPNAVYPEARIAQMVLSGGISGENLAYSYEVIAGNYPGLRLIGINSHVARFAALASVCCWPIVEIDLAFGLILPIAIAVLFALWTLAGRWYTSRINRQLRKQAYDLSYRRQSLDEQPRLLLRGDPSSILEIARSEPMFGDPQVYRVFDDVRGWWLLLWPLVPSCLNSRVLEREFLEQTIFEGWGRVIVIATIVSFFVLGFIRELPITSNSRVYYRIIPGRLDRLEGGAFSFKRKLALSIDLKDKQVICIAPSAQVVIKTYFQSDEKSHVIMLRQIDAPLGLVRALFEAGRSDQRDYAIPEDALFG